jgi:shikimate dehydrogenase
MTAPTHPVLTLADLERWSVPGTGLAVLGHPIAHSLSPVMHNAALAELAGQDPRLADWRYHKFDFTPAELPHALGLLHRHGFAGLNLTVPHKEAGLTLAESADDFARAAGATNTLVRTATGWHAANTDGPGLAGALRSELGLELRGRPVVLLGAGGAARAAAAQCLHDGAAALWIGNRGLDRAAALLRHLAPYARGTALECFPLGAPPAQLPVGAIVINCTTVGLKGEPQPPVDLRRLPQPAAVFDMIYAPAETALLRSAAELGLPRANGLAMLVHQGAAALSRWTGRPAPFTTMRDAVRRALP